MVEKRLSLVKPTLDTPFHIDFDWWTHYDREWRVHLLGLLTEEEKQFLLNLYYTLTTQTNKTWRQKSL